tara:strand:- start:587 stop:787 length:201 start_codon:yes stop_codon:yes gene_type:complete
LGLAGLLASDAKAIFDRCVTGAWQAAESGPSSGPFRQTGSSTGTTVDPEYGGDRQRPQETPQQGFV